MLALGIASILLTQSQSKPIPDIDWNNLPYQQKVKQMADGWRWKYHLPGVWVALIKNGEVVACVATGVKNIETGAPALVTDHLNVGSVSKAITGMMIAQFVAKGVINYETTVGELFPELARKYPTSPLSRASLAQLLSHTSGLRGGDFTNTVDTGAGGLKWRRSCLEAAFADKGTVEPGTRYLYSNGAVLLAVVMVEKALARDYSYEQWITGTEGKAIGLTNPKSLSWTREPEEDDVFPHYIDAYGTISANKKLRRVAESNDTKFAFAPQGSCSITLIDLCRFSIATMNNSAQLPISVFDAVCNRVSVPLRSDTYASWHKATLGWLYHEGGTGRGEVAVVRSDVSARSGFVAYTNGMWPEELVKSKPNIIGEIQADLHRLQHAK